MKVRTGVVTGLLLVTACAPAAPPRALPPSATREIVANAVNQTGLVDVSEEVWVEWAVRACEERAHQDPEVAARLAGAFVDEELGGTIDEGADLEFVMFINGLVACRALGG